MQATLVPVKTSAATETTSSVSSAIHSDSPVSESFSSPSTFVSKRSGIVTRSINQSSRERPHLQPPHKTSSPQSLLSSASSFSFHNFAPFSGIQPPVLSLPTADIPGHSLASRKLTATFRQVCAGTVSSTGISDQVCTSTSTDVGISNQVHICSVPAVGIFDKVRMCSTRATGISDQVCTHTVPVGISNPVCLHTVPSVGISNPVCPSNTSAELAESNAVRSGNIACRGALTSTSSMLHKAQNSAPVVRIQRVLLPATNSSSRQSQLLSSASVPSSFSVCSRGLSTFQMTVGSPAKVASTSSLTHSVSVTGTSSNDRHFLDSILSLKSHPSSSCVSQARQMPASSLRIDKLRLNSGGSPVPGAGQVKVSPVPLSAVRSMLTKVLRPRGADTSITGSVTSSMAQTSHDRVVARPTFVLFSPQHQPLLEKIALQLSLQQLSPSKSTAPTPTEITNARNSADYFLCSQTASGVDAGTESVIAVASPANLCCHGNRKNSCCARGDRSVIAADVGDVKVSESVAMATASLSDRGILCRSNRESTKLTADVAGDKVSDLVVGNREMLSPTDVATADAAKASVVMVTASSVDSFCYSNSKMSSVTADAANVVAMESVAVPTTVVNHRHDRESLSKSNRRKCRHSNTEMSSLADETPVSVAMESVVTDAASQVDHHDDREMFGVAGSVMNAGVEKKSKRVNLCTEVNNFVYISHVVLW